MSSRPGYSGKQVLVATGEADDLVREDRTQNERHIVVDHGAVDPDPERCGAACRRELGDAIRATASPRRRNAGGVPPGMGDDRRVRIALARCPGRVAEVCGERLLAHLPMSAEGDQNREPADPAVECTVNCCEQQGQRAGPRSVRNQHADTAAIERGGGQLLGDEGANLPFTQYLPRPTDLGDAGGPQRWNRCWTRHLGRQPPRRVTITWSRHWVTDRPLTGCTPAAKRKQYAGGRWGTRLHPEPRSVVSGGPGAARHRPAALCECACLAVDLPAWSR